MYFFFNFSKGGNRNIKFRKGSIFSPSFKNHPPISRLTVWRLPDFPSSKKKLAKLIGHLNGTGELGGLGGLPRLFHHTPENQTFLIFLKHMLKHPSISHTPVLRWLAVKLTRTEVLIRAFKIGFIWKTCIDDDTARYWKRKTGKIPLPSGIEIHQVLKSISVKCLVIEYTQEASWPQFFGKGVVGCRPDKAERPLMITVAL